MSGAINVVTQSMGTYLSESGETPSAGARFFGLVFMEAATVLFYGGLAPLLAGAIRYGVSTQSCEASG